MRQLHHEACGGILRVVHGEIVCGRCERCLRSAEEIQHDVVEATVWHETASRVQVVGADEADLVREWRRVQ